MNVADLVAERENQTENPDDEDGDGGEYRPRATTKKTAAAVAAAALAKETTQEMLRSILQDNFVTLNDAFKYYRSLPLSLSFFAHLIFVSILNF